MTITIVKKIKLFPEGDKNEVARVYNYIRNGQYAQYRALNLMMGALASKYYACGRDLNNKEFAEYQKVLFSKESMDNLLGDIAFATGCDTKSAVTQIVRQDFRTSVKNGLAKGERSVTNYKKSYPLIVRGRNIMFFHDYESDEAFYEHIYDDNLNLYIKTVNRIIYKVSLGNVRNKGDRVFRETIKHIMDGSYEIGQSGISVTKKRIIMNLTIRKPEENVKLDSSRTLGIKLGEHVTVNSFINSHNKFLIGNAEELLRMRTQLACQRSRIQSNLRYTKGGRGRNNKLKAYERLSKREKAFVKNFNHNISRQIVNYALKNRCACIVMEDFNGYDDEKNKFPYERWTYYDLQEMIKYKAAGYGIKVIREPVTLADFKTDMDIAKYLAGVTDAKK